jgi:hypothetical protein
MGFGGEDHDFAVESALAQLSGGRGGGETSTDHDDSHRLSFLRRPRVSVMLEGVTAQ